MNKPKLSIADWLRLGLTLLQALVALWATLSLFSPRWQSRTGISLFAFIQSIPVEIQIFIFVSAILIIAACNIILVFNRKATEIETLPFIQLAGCGIDNVYQHINDYGANSFIAHNLNHDRYLVYLDIKNEPRKKDKDKSDAIHVSIQLSFYNVKDRKVFIYKNYTGRWIGMQDARETERGINHTFVDIASDGYPKRLGIGYIDEDSDTLILLDLQRVDLHPDVLELNPSICLQAGKYVVVAMVKGNYLWNIPSFAFDLSIEKGAEPELKIKKDGMKWVKAAIKEHNAMWTKRG